MPCFNSCITNIFQDDLQFKILKPNLMLLQNVITLSLSLSSARLYVLCFYYHDQIIIQIIQLFIMLCQLVLTIHGNIIYTFHTFHTLISKYNKWMMKWTYYFTSVILTYNSSMCQNKSSLEYIAVFNYISLNNNTV